MEENFLQDQCERCQGPILAKPEKKIVFIEDSLDYIQQTVWICYACGHENTLQSEPHFVF